jgi:hypothetical protein
MELLEFWCSHKEHRRGTEAGIVLGLRGIVDLAPIAALFPRSRIRTAHTRHSTCMGENQFHVAYGMKHLGERGSGIVEDRRSANDVPICAGAVA